ncbi:MAG: phosphosulfolactate synthase [Betaproteobacteria bacterium]|nr:phosphosulfolactate synthase [Betaproteobacteria bacterium]
MERKAFDCVPVLERMAKPRTRGITFAEDAYFSHLGLSGARDLMQCAGDCIDIIKLAATTTRYQPREFLKQKIAIYREYGVDVFVGGVFLELALSKGVAKQFLEEAKYLGVNMLEVSDSALSVTLDQKIEIVKWVKRAGFKVLAECGRKMADSALSVAATKRSIERLLEAGAFKVIVESDEVEHALNSGNMSEVGNIAEMVLAAGPENVILETPLGASYKVAREFFYWAVQTFGSEVNVGNVSPDHVTLLEMIRRGSYWRGWYKMIDTTEIARENQAAKS